MLAISGFFSVYFTIYGVKNIVRYTKDFVPERFVVSRLLCIFFYLKVRFFGCRILHSVLISFKYDHRSRRRFESRVQATKIQLCPRATPLLGPGKRRDPGNEVVSTFKNN